MKLLDLCISLGITPSTGYPYIYQGGGGFIYKSDIKPQYTSVLDGWVFDKSFAKYIRTNYPDYLYRCFAKRFFINVLKQKSLVEYLNQVHQEYLLKNINKDHLFAAAWIAAPSDIPLDNEMALEIFTNLGAIE